MIFAAARLRYDALAPEISLLLFNEPMLPLLRRIYMRRHADADACRRIYAVCRDDILHAVTRAMLPP